jgi:hypothetical protein
MLALVEGPMLDLSPRNPTAILALLACTALSLACPGPGNDTGEPRPEPARITDAHSVALTLDLDAASFPLEAGQDARLRWTELRTDLLSQELESCEALSRISLHLLSGGAPDEILEQLARGSLASGSLSATWNCEPQGCACALSEFSYVGHPLVPASDFVAGRGTWLLTLSVEEREGLQGLAFLEPLDDQAGSAASLDDDSFGAVASGSLDTSSPLVLPLGGSMEVDWSGLSVDGQGEPLDLARLGALRLDRLTLPAEQAVADLLALDQRSVQRWELPLQGETQASLLELAGDALAQPEPGSSWLLSLWSGSRLLDLPLVVVELQPQG